MNKTDKTVNKPGTLLLVEYTDIIDEAKLNWGFKDGYFEEDKIPVLFIFSNFSYTIKTNRQSLIGSIRTYVEERKGIIFFPNTMKKELKEFVREALKKEKVDLDFYPFRGEKYKPDYLAQICETCFSIKNIKLKEVIKMATPKNEQTKISHLQMIEELTPKPEEDSQNENLRAIINEGLICFAMDKKEKDIVKYLELNQPTTQGGENFKNLATDRAFKNRFFELFSGNNSVSDRLKRYYDVRTWKFDSLLILYSGKKKRIFIQDSPESVLFLNSNDTTFQSLNTRYSLINFNYKSEVDQKIIMAKDKVADKFVIWVGDKQMASSGFNLDTSLTFPGCTTSINQFLKMITHSQSTEYRFFYDKMAVIVKIVGAKYFIESYVANL